MTFLGNKTTPAVRTPAASDRCAVAPDSLRVVLRHLQRLASRCTCAIGFWLAGVVLAAPALGTEGFGQRPNIILIMADDLGYGEVGCYGQKHIKTPTIDRLAAEGVRFTQFYAGSPVCAPSRCTLLTGKHTGQAFIRDNHELGGWKRDDPEGQLPLPENTVTLAKILKQKHYATCAIGKWGLGGPGSSGHPNKQGFDHWMGYLCQRVAHNYYPTHLWRNNTKVVLDNEWFASHQKLTDASADAASYTGYRGEQYAPDVMIEEALAFVREHRDQPFFLYYATPVPHAAIQVPDDSLAEYVGKWPETPYGGSAGYLPHQAPRAGYAAMVTRMDRDIGRLVKLVADLGLDDSTLIIFTSDNGPTFNGGTDSTFFNSAGPLRGLKCDLYEGGIRVPFVARWKGHIRPGTVSDHVSAMWDILPTLTELAGLQPRSNVNGISFVPALLGKDGQRPHDYLYWEFRPRGGGQAVRMGHWKGLRLGISRQDQAPIELYDLQADIGETTNVAAQHPQIVARIAETMRTARTKSEHFPLPVPPVP